MKELIKKILKHTFIYTLYRNKKLRIAYANKNGLDYKDSKNLHVIQSYKLGNILKKSKIKDIGVGSFFYSLDTSIIIDKRKRVIGNMPVDYKYIMDTCREGMLKEIDEYVNRIADDRITLKKPTCLKEALQMILLFNSLLWQTGHTLVGLGRLDKVLSEYAIESNAEELICDFLRTLHKEYEYKSNTLIGDTGQIIILGGLEENGNYYSNQYTYLFIKCLKKISLPDPKILLRCSQNMPVDLMELAVDCVSTGIGSPLFSNDDILVYKLQEFGYEKDDAFNYGVSACWEPLSIGNSFEQNNLDNIKFGQCAFDMIMDDRFIDLQSFDDILSLYFEKLLNDCNRIKINLDKIEWEKDPLLTFYLGLNEDISKGSTKYNNYGILSVGMSSAVNTILNIKRYVFDEKIYTLSEIKHMVETDNVRAFSDNIGGFGTDTFDSIELTNKIIKTTEEYLLNYRNMFGGKVKFGLSSPAYIASGIQVGATLDGRKAGEPFATHISRDKKEPITEIFNFESKLHFSGISSNANVLDIMVQSSLIKDNTKKFTQLILAGIKQGIFQLQMNVLSYAKLVDAKEHPDKYSNLIVRVWGFSAYFNDLPEEYKDNLIKRAKEIEGVA